MQTLYSLPIACKASGELYRTTSWTSPESIFSAPGTIWHEANLINVLGCTFQNHPGEEAEQLTRGPWVPGGCTKEQGVRLGRDLRKMEGTASSSLLKAPATNPQQTVSLTVESDRPTAQSAG